MEPLRALPLLPTPRDMHAADRAASDSTGEAGAPPAVSRSGYAAADAGSWPEV